ncbi:amino acid permease, partial [Rhizobium leguminosarum]|nr:amino acid permease [Rhizobium ruizarguesonis]
MADAPAERLPLGDQLRRRKPLPLFRRESGADEEGNELARTFGVLQLTMISIGATLGTGILVILGESVPMAGPAVWISFVIAGFAALLSALSYAELAGRVPVSGSSYSYSFATMGEG